ncbi:MAG TPA: DUF4129 domain-containing protein [Gemmataceae bacterium]|nr:DUF4129 domain-containing protein [Gemmataceae bacterium]
MSRNRPGPTPADYVVLVISPVLIMALVSSLVFFLVEVLYAGEYEGRLKWILFFFIFGAVLIARISMMSEIANRAALYGLVLGLLVWLGLVAYIKFPPGSRLASFAPFINLFLMILIWWCAHRLTWDCTFIDESAEATGQGLLRAAGLEKASTAEAAPAEEQADETAEAEKHPGWLERYRRYQEERKRKHTPGVWVVYFSLAALPLFGLGQSLIPPSEIGRRRYVFWLLGIYVASGLGLLLTTAFLGLRRYLRQRGLRMPAAVTGVWLSLGTVLIAALLLAGALLPRPSAEYPLVTLNRIGSPDRDASHGAMKRDGAGKGEGQPSADSPDGQKDEAGGQGEKGDGKGPGEKSGQGEGKGRGESSGQGKGQSESSGQGSGKDRDGSSGKSSGKDGSGKGKASGAGDRQGQPKGEPGDRQGGAGADRKREDAANRQDGSPPSGDEPRGSSLPDRFESSPPAISSNPASGIGGALAGLMNFLKWVVFAILVLLVVLVVLRALLQFLANFTGWARGLLDSLRALWEGLFGWLQRTEQAAPEAEIEAAPSPPPPFSSFRNPFHDGRADRLPPDELVRYSFAALQAWAWERDLGREPGETPLEFTGRIGQEVPALEAELRQLTVLYARAVYARGPLPAGCLDMLRQFWQRLETVTEQPLSA